MSKFTPKYVLFLLLFMLLNSVNLSAAIQLQRKTQLKSNIFAHKRPLVGNHAFDKFSVVAAADTSAINQAAFKSIAKLISTCSIGVWAAKSNILNAEAISVLSKLIFNLFQPCLLFVSVSNTVAKMQTTSGGNNFAMYMLPSAALFSILTGFIVGKIISLLIYGLEGCDSENAKQLLICTTFANAGPLPLVFTDGLFANHEDKTLLPKAVAYISLYLLGTTPLFWIFSPLILSEKKEKTIVEKAGTKVASMLIGSQLTKFLEVAARVFNPPVVASILGMVVGFTPILRNIFTTSEGVLNPIYEAMKTLGAAYLPCVLLVLAGSLSSSIGGPKAAHTPFAPPGANTDSNSISNIISAENTDFAVQVLCIYLARFLLMPVVGFSLIHFAKQHVPGLTTLFINDPMLLFVLLLQMCMPSAQNSTVARYIYVPPSFIVYQLMGKKDAASKLAKILMFLYVAGVPAITFWLVKILQMTHLA